MESTSERMETPRAAGAAGLAFAVLLAAAIVLMRLAVPAADAADAPVDPDLRWAVRTALEIVPFAGIFFLWFMGALRAHAGEREDRFVSTVFLGSGFVFVATLFVAAAAAGTVLDETTPSGFGRHYAYTVLATYGMRMAAVFVFTTSTIGRRLGVFPRPLTLLGYAAGLILLVVGSSVPWSELVVPVWAFTISLHILRTGMRQSAGPP
ncbi:hypothetical protein AMK16_07690 [Streptomyces sp. CB00455]|uniref:hypothetical protein n=1 Tax=Streptomyces sp. CB00455 TaxID=1703927 RepID=UPI00093F0C88|nr:hypothetical protein [Streptomyces sp. CB00455]OKK20375.1 hypothetical protein AMK16_07690 [Streptomyces sp. CB00455]